jgi:hypothetical protein
MLESLSAVSALAVYFVSRVLLFVGPRFHLEVGRGSICCGARKRQFGTREFSAVSKYRWLKAANFPLLPRFQSQSEIAKPGQSFWRSLNSSRKSRRFSFVSPIEEGFPHSCVRLTWPARFLLQTARSWMEFPRSKYLSFALDPLSFFGVCCFLSSLCRNPKILCFPTALPWLLRRLVLSSTPAPSIAGC